MEAKNNNTTQPNTGDRALRVLGLPVLLYWPLFLLGLFFWLSFALPSPSCSGTLLMCHTDFKPSWPGYVLQSAYSVLMVLLIRPTRKTILLALALAIGFGLFDYWLSNKLTLVFSLQVIIQRSLFSIIGLVMFALLTFGLVIQPKYRWRLVAVALLLTALVWLMSLGVSDLFTSDRVRFLYYFLGPLIWPIFSTLYDYLEGRWTHAHAVVLRLTVIIVSVIWLNVYIGYLLSIF